MDAYAHVSMGATRGAADVVSKMLWPYGRHALASAARLWYTGSAIRIGWPPSAGAFFPGPFRISLSDYRRHDDVLRLCLGAVSELTR